MLSVRRIAGNLKSAGNGKVSAVEHDAAAGFLRLVVIDFAAVERERVDASHIGGSNAAAIGGGVAVYHAAIHREGVVIRHAAAVGIRHIFGNRAAVHCHDAAFVVERAAANHRFIFGDKAACEGKRAVVRHAAAVGAIVAGNPPALHDELSAFRHGYAAAIVTLIPGNLSARQRELAAVHDQNAAALRAGGVIVAASD